MSLTNLLHFNSSACLNDLYQEISKTADILIEEYEAEIRHGMYTPEGAESISLGISTDDKEKLHREVIGGAWAIIDSYGTGSKMDKNNPFLNEYRQSSYYNPARYGYEIVGRPKGEYTNIFGEEDYSSGKSVGRNLERFPSISVIAPSKAFQNALIWFKAGNRIDKRIVQCIRKFNFARYFTNR